MLKKLLVVIALIFMYGAGFLTFCMVTYPTDRVINTWKQKNDYQYNSFGGYNLSVVENDYYLGKIPYFSGERRYYIYVGKDTGKPTYGHVINYSFHPETYGSNDIEEYIKKSEVEWQEDGVLFKEDSGHRLFVPKSMINVR